jgi:molecular chaperone HscC
MGMIVGIDLGTTNSLCAVFRNGQPELLRNAHGGVLTPSIVGVLEDGRVIVGDAAREYRVTHPDRCASAFKRLMGTNRKLTLGKREYSAIELSSLVLRSLKEDAEQALGEPVEEAVITVPAYFNDTQRKATRHAGELAGLKVRRIVNEPTAAALTYGFHDRTADKKLLVVDLGGGTFDVTLMQIFEGTLEIIATAGENFLGGEDFTSRLVSTICTRVGVSFETAELKMPLFIARLREECERAKREFVENATSEIVVPEADGSFAPNAKRIKISRDDFATTTRELLARIRGPVGKALRDGHCEPKDVRDVILVGGATRMTVVKDLVRTLFDKEPLSTFNPDEVVALGAAVQAALMTDDEAVDDMVMTDVCPFTLGVEISKQFGHEQVDGYFSPIIHRNTTIPVSREEVYSTVSPMQDQIRLRVFQGESRRVKDNFSLGELLVTGIPPTKEQQPVRVRFTYDLNGILEVEAIVDATQKRFRVVLANHAGHLDKSELEAAVRKMQAVKFYPRDDLANRKLLLFAERVVGETPPDSRASLEFAMDLYEKSMSDGDRGQFDIARANLLGTLEELGFEYSEGNPEAGDSGAGESERGHQ